MTSFPHNTKRRGQVTIFSYKEGKKYVSVCLELDIVEEGDDMLELNRSMVEAVSGYLTTVCKKGLSEDALNRSAPERYWKKYHELLSSQVPRRRVVPYRPSRPFNVNVLPIRELCAA